MARLLLALAVGGLGCGRTEFVVALAQGESTSGSSAETGGVPSITGGPDTGLPDTGLPDTSFPGTGFPGTGPVTTGPVTFTSGFDSGSNDTEIDETGFPGTSTTTTVTTTTATSGVTTDGGTTDGGTTSGGTTSGGTTSGGTTDGSTTSGGTTGGSTGGGPTCLDAVDCVIACGGPSPGCINMCDNDLSPGDNMDFVALETCIILACIFNGSCSPGSFGDPACIACRLDGQLDPMTVGCENEAMNCT